MTPRGQSTVVGVAVLLALTMASVAVLTAGAGTVIDGAATGAAVDRVADRFTALLPGSTAAGANSGSVRVPTGAFETVGREVRLLDGGGIAREWAANAFVYTAGSRRVAAIAGAVVTGAPGAGTFTRGPPIGVGAVNGSSTVYLAVPTLTTAPSRDIDAATDLDLDVTTTSHTVSVPRGDYRIAVETVTPTPWRRWFTDRGLQTALRDLDGDGVQSVVATLPPGARIEVVVIRTAVTVDG